MSKLELSKSKRKFIRLEKARIRSQFFDITKQNELIGELYKNFLNSNHKRKTEIIEKVEKDDKSSKIKKSESKKVKLKIKSKISKKKK